jgi:phosphoglycolate phosphatase
MFKACIFDLDGTLVDSLKDLAVSVNHALGLQGLPTHEVEKYRYFVGRGAAKLVEEVLPEGQRDKLTQEATSKLFNEYYNLHFLDNTLPYDGIVALIEKLKQRGIKLAVVSNKPDLFVRKIVDNLFAGYFDSVCGHRDDIPHKPDPTIVNEVCSLISTSPQDCVFIGDSGVDMQTANNAGMFAVGALWGFRTRDELAQNGAAALIERPEDLLALL